MEDVVKGVAVVVAAVLGCCEELSRTVDRYSCVCPFRKVSKSTRALSMLFEVYAGIIWYLKRKHFFNLMQLGNVVTTMDSEVSFVDDLGQSQPPNQAMAEKVMSKDNDQHCIGQGQTNGTPPSLVFHYL